MLTITLLLALSAFICTMLSIRGYVPLWVAVTLLCIIELLRSIPLGR